MEPITTACYQRQSAFLQQLITPNLFQLNVERSVDSLLFYTFKDTDAGFNI